MRGKRVAAALLGTGVIVAAGIGGVVAVRAGEALPGTTVAGTQVGGLGRADVATALVGLEDRRTSGELSLLAVDVTTSVDRSMVDLDTGGTVDRALEAGRDRPVDAVLGSLLTRGDRAVDPVLSVDEPALRARLDELADELDRPAAPGGFTVDGVTVTAVAPVEGRTLDRDAAVRPVTQALLAGGPGPVELPVTQTPAAATPAQVETVTAAAQATLSTSYSLTQGDVALRLTAAEIAPLLSSTPVDGGGLALALDPEAMLALVTAEAAPLAVAPRPATFGVASTPPVLDGKENLTWSPVPASVSVLPATDGRSVDIPATTQALTTMVLAATPTGDLPLVVVPAPLTTAGAQAAGVSSLIGTFTTYFPAGQPRATNIRRIAELVNGTYVTPGERFSLNGAAGERTRARGFVADSAIVDGVLVDEVGGGVSQFATTLFNAAFFAGLPIEQHKPHSFYISRYPAGRESTVYFGQIDVRFRNDTARGLLVRTRSTPSSVTVELYGDNGGRTVTAEHGPRQPRPDGGFLIAVTRGVTGGDGVSSRRVFTTTYDPVPPPTP